jgi:hypothetical protein
MTQAPLVLDDPGRFLGRRLLGVNAAVDHRTLRRQRVRYPADAPSVTSLINL